MPTTKEILDIMTDMQADLMKPTNLLSKFHSKKAWSNLTDDIKKKNKEKLKEGFHHLEDVIHRYFFLTPAKLHEQKPQYAKGRATILSTTDVYHPPGIPELRKKAQVHSNGGTKSPLYKTNKERGSVPKMQLNHVTKTGASKGKEKKTDKGEQRKPIENGYADTAAQGNYSSHFDMGHKQSDDKRPVYQERPSHPHTSRGVFDGDKREKEVIQRKMEKMERELKNTQNKLQEAEKDKEYWMDRMSKVTGDRLTRDNPDIADLSDPKRPQKLGEQYSILYDDEWTDAIVILTENKGKVTERDGIDILVSILKGSYEKCVEIADDQFTKMQAVLLQNENSKDQTNDIKCPIEVQRSLKDTQKLASGQNLSVVQKKVKKELKLPEGFVKLPMHELEDFVDKCTDICWAMVMQSPRMEFEYPECKKGEKFNKDHFKEFTKSGDRLDYLVWPAMVTHRHGSLLVKGTVQPITKN